MSCSTATALPDKCLAKAQRSCLALIGGQGKSIYAVRVGLDIPSKYSAARFLIYCVVCTVMTLELALGAQPL